MKDNIFTPESIKMLQDAATNNLININKYNFAERFSIKIGKIYVKRANNKTIIDLDDNTDKQYMKVWRNSVASIFLNDVKHNNLNNYYIGEYNNIYYLLKLVTDDEDIIVIDNKYKVISMSSNDKFTNNICNIQFEFDVKVDEDDEDENIEDIELVSLELFNEEDLV